jgi:hypothetical protein
MEKVFYVFWEGEGDHLTKLLNVLFGRESVGRRWVIVGICGRVGIL